MADPTCPHCGYPLVEFSGNVCPRCGEKTGLRYRAIEIESAASAVPSASSAQPSLQSSEPLSPEHYLLPGFADPGEEYIYQEVRSCWQAVPASKGGSRMWLLLASLLLFVFV